jgi:DDE family transposase
MASVTEIARAMETVLTLQADATARQVGFVRRQSKVRGAGFVQTLVLGWLKKPEASYSDLAQSAAAVGLQISIQGLEQRFTAEAASLLEQTLNSAVSQVISAEPTAIPILGRFNGVVVQDSSIINLPDALAMVWQGCGDRHGGHAAALKLQVRLDLQTGTLFGPLLEDGRANDNQSPSRTAPLARGALSLRDLGYFSLPQLGAFDAAEVFYLTRLLLQTAVFDLQGSRLDLLEVLAKREPVDLPVQLGVAERLQARLLAVQVPQEVADQRRRRLKRDARRRGKQVTKARLALAGWTILVTNAPVEKLSLDEALVLARVRWQIELIFKLWKSHGKVDEWRSQKPWRILAETYAKLTAMVVQHWLFLVTFWPHPNRSLVKAAQTVRSQAALIEASLVGLLDLDAAIGQIQRCLDTGCRMNARKRAPNTYQQLLRLTNAP